MKVARTDLSEMKGDISLVTRTRRYSMYLLTYRFLYAFDDFLIDKFSIRFLIVVLFCSSICWSIHEFISFAHMVI